MGSRVVFDKRTLRKRYGAAFSAAIRDYDEGGSFLDEIATQMGGDPSPLSNDEPVQVRALARVILGALCRGGPPAPPRLPPWLPSQHPPRPDRCHQNSEPKPRRPQTPNPRSLPASAPCLRTRRRPASSTSCARRRTGCSSTRAARAPTCGRRSSRPTTRRCSRLARPRQTPRWSRA